MVDSLCYLLLWTLLTSTFPKSDILRILCPIIFRSIFLCPQAGVKSKCMSLTMFFFMLFSSAGNSRKKKTYPISSWTWRQQFVLGATWKRWFYHSYWCSQPLQTILWTCCSLGYLHGLDEVTWYSIHYNVR